MHGTSHACLAACVDCLGQRLTVAELCRVVQQAEASPDNGYVDQAQEAEHDDEPCSLETIEEKGESECTPVTEQSNALSSSNATPPKLHHDAHEPLQHIAALEPPRSTVEAVPSQFPATAARDSAYLIARLAALEDSGEQFAFALKGKSKIRYKKREPRKSMDAQHLSFSATVGLPRRHGDSFSTPTPQTPAHSVQHTPAARTPGRAVTPGVSVDMEDSNYFNYFVSPPLDDQLSEGTLGSTQELSGSHKGSHPGSARQQEASGAHGPPHLHAFREDSAPQSRLYV